MQLGSIIPQAALSVSIAIPTVSLALIIIRSIVIAVDSAPVDYNYFFTLTTAVTRHVQLVSTVKLTTTPALTVISPVTDVNYPQSVASPVLVLIIG